MKHAVGKTIVYRVAALIMWPVFALAQQEKPLSLAKNVIERARQQISLFRIILLAVSTV